MMRKLDAPPLSLDAQKILSKLQKDVDSKQGFAAQVARAVQIWKGKNTSGRKPAFEEIKPLLTSMGWPLGGARCHYCEVSVPDEIEHIFPKTLFPDRCFAWDNYLYVCGNCNGPKNNKFAVINAQGQLVHVITDPPPTSSPVGKPAVINPRAENPAQWITLHLWSGRFIPVSSDKQSEEYLIADYVINTLINLNREPLPTVRRDAFLSLFYSICAYCTTSASPAGNNHLRTIQRHPQRSVWLEVLRQKPIGSASVFALFDELLAL